MVGLQTLGRWRCKTPKKWWRQNFLFFVLFFLFFLDTTPPPFFFLKECLVRNRDTRQICVLHILYVFKGLVRNEIGRGDSHSDFKELVAEKEANRREIEREREKKKGEMWGIRKYILTIDKNTLQNMVKVIVFRGKTAWLVSPFLIYRLSILP